MPLEMQTADYSRLPYLRSVLAPEYAILPSDRIAAQMQATYGPGAAEAYDAYVEGFFDDIGRSISSAARDVAKVAVKAAPIASTIGGGVLQGALSGSQFGLPGIIAGDALGGTGAGLSAYGGGSAKDIGGVLTGVTGLAGQFSPLGRIGAAVGPVVQGLAGAKSGGAAGAATSALSGILGAVAGPGAAGATNALAGLFGGSSATSQLLSLLGRPETQQALAALNLGSMGRRTVPIGPAQTPVPTTAISSLIGHLAGQATDEAMAWSTDAESDMNYMLDPAGRYVGDPAHDRDRFARVWTLLNDAQAQRVLTELIAALAQSAEPQNAEAADAESSDAEAADAEAAYYDELDYAELRELDGEVDAEDAWESELEYAL